MARVRTDNVFGTLTDNPLTAAATTMNSAGLADLAAVAAPQEAIIILDPNRVSGAPEHVVVTAHTGSATSATIVRGQFGTTARSHALATAWVHAPFASNATTFVTAADDQGDFVPMNAWESWTPTLTNLTLGNGTVTAKFVRIGRTIHFRFKFLLGSTSAVGTGPQFTLPVTAHADYAGQDLQAGRAELADFGTASYDGILKFESTSAVSFQVPNAAGTYVVANAVTATVPHTWATSDFLWATGTYEAAS